MLFADAATPLPLIISIADYFAAMLSAIAATL